MTQAAVAWSEARGTVPTLSVLDRLASVLDAELVVRTTPHSHLAEQAVPMIFKI
jgi:hypothetical protein